MPGKIETSSPFVYPVARPARSLAPAVVHAAPPVLSRRWLSFLLAGTAGVLLLAVVVVWVSRSSAPSARFTNSLGMEFARIPAGKFLRGSPATEELRNDDEGPQHQVTITRSFFMGVHEVTAGQFRAFIEQTGHQTEAEASGRGAQDYDRDTQRWLSDPERTWRNPGWPQDDRDPVVCVTWNDAEAFCGWLSLQENRKYRLPTEAEWEYACRGGLATTFGHGESLSSLDANFNGNVPWGPAAVPGPYRARTAPVGSFRPNPFGIHDMHGNVTEWCADYYAPYPEGPQTDPTGPPDGVFRVQRGGAWCDPGNRCRCALRGKNPADSAFTVIGFRIVYVP